MLTEVSIVFCHVLQMRWARSRSRVGIWRSMRSTSSVILKAFATADVDRASVVSILVAESAANRTSC